MSAHTPGPWEVDPLTAKVNQVATGLPLAIAMLQWPSNDRSEHETKANARLIAAAPELLEVLEDIWKFLEDWGVDRYYKEAKVIIAKAKGENHE